MKLAILLFAATLAAPHIYTDSGACDAGCPDAGFELTRWARQWRLEPRPADQKLMAHCGDDSFPIDAARASILNPKTCTTTDAGYTAQAPVRVPVDHYECWRDAGWSDCP
jgi:hypothetical protein